MHTNQEVITWEEELAKDAVEHAANARTPNPGAFISTLGGRFSYDGQSLPDTIKVVVVGSVRENNWYAKPFDSENPTGPACFAFSVPGTPMRPHETIKDPQAPVCGECPKNVFGSATVGRGKACKNIVKLSVIMADELDSDGPPQSAMLRVPVTSAKNWEEYVRELATSSSRPPYAVITDITIKPNAKSQFAITFKVGKLLSDQVLTRSLKEMGPAALATLTEPYAASDADATPSKF